MGMGRRRGREKGRRGRRMREYAAVTNFLYATY